MAYERDGDVASSPTASRTATASRSTATARSSWSKGAACSGSSPDGEREWIVEKLGRGGGDGFCLDTEGNYYVAATVDHGVRVVDPTGNELDFLALDGDGVTTNCCFGGADGRTLFATDAVPGRVVVWEGLPHPGLPLHTWPADRPDRRRQTPSNGRTRAARSRAQARRVGERPAQLGQVEVLDAEPAPVVELVEPPDHGSEVHNAGGIVDVDLRRARTALAQLHVIGVCQQLERVAAPVGHVPGVDQQPQPRDLADHRPACLGRIHHGARPRLEQRAGRGPEPARRSAPTCPGPSRVRRGGAPARSRLRERRRAADGQRQRRRVHVDQHVDVLERVGQRELGAHLDRPRRVDDVDDAERNRHAGYFCSPYSMPVRHDHADVLEVLAEDLSKLSATCSGSQPPSRHIHAICFGCWKIV